MTASSHAGEKRRWQNLGPAARQTGATLSPLGASLVMARGSRSESRYGRRSTGQTVRDETGGHLSTASVNGRPRRAGATDGLRGMRSREPIRAVREGILTIGQDGEPTLQRNTSIILEAVEYLETSTIIDIQFLGTLPEVPMLGPPLREYSLATTPISRLV